MTNNPSTWAAVFSSDTFSSATIAVKLGEVGLNRTLRKSLSRHAVRALITGVSSGGQSSFVVKTTGPGQLKVQVLVSDATFFAEWPDQRRRITSRWKPGGNPISASKVRVSDCLRQRLRTHWTGNGRGWSRMVSRASSNQREERRNVAFSWVLPALQRGSRTRPLPRHAVCTQCSRAAP